MTTVWPVPRVTGADHFTLRKRQRYTAVIVNAATAGQADVVADRTAATLESWLHEYPGVRVVGRVGSVARVGSVV